MSNWVLKCGSLWPSGIGMHLGRNMLWVWFLAVSDIICCTFFFQNFCVNMYPENPEGTQVIIGSMNMEYISNTARNIPCSYSLWSFGSLRDSLGTYFLDTKLVLKKKKLLTRTFGMETNSVPESFVCFIFLVSWKPTRWIYLYCKGEIVMHRTVLHQYLRLVWCAR